MFHKYGQEVPFLLSEQLDERCKFTDETLHQEIRLSVIPGSSTLTRHVTVRRYPECANLLYCWGKAELGSVGVKDTIVSIEENISIDVLGASADALKTTEACGAYSEVSFGL
jgi:hypothetical protein